MADHRTRNAMAFSRPLVVVALVVHAAVAWADQAGNTPADAGERLFAGRTRFANGGPPCAACHDSAGLPFPYGGSVGPDLTGAYTKYGQRPLETVLSTLYFPTMQALFAHRDLTPAERQDLIAFFQRAETQQRRGSLTAGFALAAFIGALLLLAIAWAAWRSRLRGVRRSIVAEAKGRRLA